ncbi:SsrA-binding protein SmpB [Patescibacteria group bacterium]|nr:SsrA-binding protein SmpB [Patescibacteria group bacterium]MBU2219806.1 SsrA-binding protein SmpB [Patescibacteria group bacterium]
MPDYAFNRQAGFEYEFLQKYEAGLVLIGQEVKSIRDSHISLKGAYVVLKDEEAWLINANIPAWQPKNTPAGYEATRSRKLLLREHEIRSLIGQSKQTGLTLVPIRVYNSKGKIKLEFALARGKKSFDKRAIIGRREADRRIQRVLRGKTED